MVAKTLDNNEVEGSKTYAMRLFTAEVIKTMRQFTAEADKAINRSDMARRTQARSCSGFSSQLKGAELTSEVIHLSRFTCHTLCAACEDADVRVDRP